MTVVLVHGILDDGSIFRRLAGALRRDGHRVLAPSLRPSDGRTGLDALAVQLARCVDGATEPEEPLDLVGFSMGALIGRRLVARHDPRARVRRYASISGPHRGSLWAHLPFNRGVREMRPGSAFLAELDAELGRLRTRPTRAYWTPFDLTVLPARTAVLPFGEARRIPALTHSGMVRHPALIADLRAFLGSAPRHPPDRSAGAR